MAIIEIPDEDLKMMRETLCVAQTALTRMPFRVTEHMRRLQRIINEIDSQRPLEPAGTHGKLHTASCGCED